MNATRGDLAALSYYGTGGTCRRIVAPTTIEELQDELAALYQDKTRLFCLGLGTNSLVLDDPWDGVAVVFHKLNHISHDNDAVRAEAGVVNTDLSRFAWDCGLAGAEWMNRLPGSLGGTVRMNARCYGGEISQIVTAVTAITHQGDLRHYADAKSLFRGYKDTSFMTNDEIIVAAEMRLRPGADREASQRQMQFCEDDRVGKGQFLYPSCGCVFKNDYAVGVPSGMLIDAARLKSATKGGARVSEKHANFIENFAKASSQDVLELSFHVRETVYRELGVWLHYEMEVLGEMAPATAKEFQRQEPARWDQERLTELRAKFSGRSSAAPY